MEDSSESLVTELCCSSILYAAREGHVNCIQQRLGRRLGSRTSEIIEAVNVHSVQNRTSPLQLSARRGHVECVDLLIDAGADVNWQDSKRQTALHHAASGKAKDERAANCARSLIAAGANVLVKNYWKETVLHTAALHCKSVEVMKVLLSANCNLEEKNLNGYTALHCAAANMIGGKKTKRRKCIGLLLAHGASVNTRNIRNATPLHLACRAAVGHISYEDIEDTFAPVRQLLEAGANVTMCRDSIELIETVCDRIRTQCHTRTHHYQYVNMLTGVLELLIEHGLSLERINEEDEQCLMSTLSKAVAYGRKDFLCCLLKVPGLKPWMMSTLLKEAVACFWDGPGRLRILLDAGASANIGYDGRMALMSCAQSLPSTPQFYNSVEMFNILVSNGAYPCNAPEGCALDDQEESCVCLCGQKMLHTAVQNGNVALVEAIFKTGIDASVPCDDMIESPSRYPLITALNVSQAHGPSLVQLLLSYGADPKIVLHQPAIESSTLSFVKDLCPRSINIEAIVSVLSLLPLIPLRCQKHQRVGCCDVFRTLISSPLTLQECCRATICSSFHVSRKHPQGLWEAVRSLPITNNMKNFLLAPFGLCVKSMLGD